MGNLLAKLISKSYVMELTDVFRLSLAGDKKKAFEVLSPYIETSEKSIVKTEAKILKAFVLNRVGHFDDAIKMLGTIEIDIKEIYNRIQNDEFTQYDLQLFSLNNLVMAFSYLKKGNLGGSQNKLDPISPLLSKFDNSWESSAIRGIYYNEYGLLYWKRGDLVSSLSYLKKSVEKFRYPINEILGMGLNDEAIAHYELGEYTKSLKILKEAETYMLKYNSKQDLGYVYGNLGRIYRTMGEMAKARDYATRSLQIKMKVDNKLDLSAEFRNIGLIEFYTGNFNESFEYLMKSLTTREEIGNQIEVSESLYYLIVLCMQCPDPKIVESQRSLFNEFVDKLDQIAKENDNELVQVRNQLIRALLLKTNHVIEDTLQSKNILIEIIAMKLVPHEIKLSAITNLCEILIKELRMVKDQNSLFNLQVYISMLLNDAQNNHLYGIMVEALMLKSKFACLEFNYRNVHSSLELALSICEEKSLEFLKLKVTKELSKIENYILNIKEVLENNSDISQAIEILELKRYLKSVSTVVNVFT